MTSSRKCQGCGKWSMAEVSHCPDCGRAYDSVDRKYSAAIENAEERTVKEKEFLNSGNFLSRLVKKSAWMIHLIFGALSTAFVWWIAVFHY